MREIEAGMRIDEKGNLTAFGTEEVNELIQGGARVVAVEPGRAIMRKIGEDEKNVRVTLVGFSVTVQLDGC